MAGQEGLAHGQDGGEGDILTLRRCCVERLSWRRSLEVLEIYVLLILFYGVVAADPEIAEIRVEGVKRDEARISEMLGVRAGGPFDSEALERGIREVLSQYEAWGHPFARVDVEKVALRKDGLHITLRVDEGPEVRLGAVRITGTSTREDLLLRVLDLPLGELYDGREVERALSRLRRLPFIQDAVPDLRYNLESGQGVLLVRVREIRANRFSAALGYAGRGISGELSLALHSPWGRGRTVEARWTRREAQADLYLMCREPWVLGLPLHLGGEFRTSLREGYSRTEWVVQAYRPFRWGEVGGSVGWERTVRGSAEGGAWGLGLEVQYEARDDPSVPRRGLGASLGVRGYPGRAEGVQVRVRGDVEGYVPMGGSLALAVGLHGGMVEGRDLSTYELLPLGGAKSLRGHWEEQFRDLRVVWSNLELYKELGAGSWGFPFLDVGYAQGKVRWGYGLGLRLRTGAGRIGLDYGLGPRDRLWEGKVHLTLEGRF